MPFEPLPWDRKEYFKARKEGRSESVASVTSSEDSRELTRCGSAEVRKRPADEYGVLLKGVNLDRQLSQPSEKISKDPSVLQFKKLCCSSAFGEICNINSRVFGNPKDLSLDGSANVLAESSCNASYSDPVGAPCQEPNSVSEGRIFEGKIGQKVAEGLQHRIYRDTDDYSVGLDCKRIRWMRTGSLSSHESGLSCSSSSKSMSVDFSNSRVELPKQNLNFCISASGDTIACVTPTTPSEEMSPWKRPRLRWGEGLAKFEKKSSGTDDEPNKSETISCISAPVSDCASPATPSSAACSSFPGSVDKPFRKASVVDDENGVVHTLVSESQKHLESTPFNLEILDLSIITHAVPSLIEMINSNNQCSEDFSSTSWSVMSKLMLLKSEILKAIDMTESQVDLFENELKSINNEPGDGCPALDVLATELTKTSGKAQQDASEMSHKPALPLHASTEVFVMKLPVDNGNSTGLKADMDSPGTVTSKLVELSPLTEPYAENSMTNNGDRFFYSDANHFPQEVQKTSKITSHAGEMSNACINGFVGSMSNDSSLFSSDSGCCMSVADRLIGSIWASNREYANKTSQDFNIDFPVAETIEHSNTDGCCKDLFLRELIVRKKKVLRFKEQAVTLKWRALHSIWKDDMNSVRNHHSKAQKQFEIFSRTSQNNRPSVRTKSLHAKRSSLNMGKLLSISDTKLCKSVLKMPSLILDDDERRTSRFLSRNGLVEDPCAAEKEKSLVNAWTSEERSIFMDKLASHGKDFKNIASFLDHKTIADCVEFYYKNHKSWSFMKTFKRQDRRKLVKSLSNNTYLVTPAKKWNMIMDTASLDILGAASELVARQSENKEQNKKLNFSGFLLHGVGRTRTLKKDGVFLDSPSNIGFAEKEIRSAGNDTGACGSASSDAISSCITGSVNQGEGHCNETPKAFSIISKPYSIPEDIQIDDEETCSDESSCELDVGYWNDREKSVFVRAVKSYGKDFCMVSRCIRTKSMDQCKSFYSKARKSLGLDIIHPDNDHEQQSVINYSIGDSTPALKSTSEAVSDTGNYEVSRRIDEDMSLSVSVMSNVDLLSPDAGMQLNACHDKSKDKERNFKVPSADLKPGGKSVDKSVSNHDPVCVWNKPAMSNNTNKQAYLCEVSEAANQSVVISPSLSFTAPYYKSSAQVETERGSMEPSLLHSHGGGNGTPNGSGPNNVSYCIEDCETRKAPSLGSADRRPLVGCTAGVPSLMYTSEGSVRDETSQDYSAHNISYGLSNSSPRYTASLPTTEGSFAKISFGETQGHFQRPLCVGNHLLHQATSDQFYVSKKIRKRESSGSAWNLNFEDSTISKGSNSDSANSLPPYASIPQRGYIQKCNSLNSNCSASDVPYFKQNSHISRNQTTNSVGPEKQEKRVKFKLFGKVLIPSSTAPEPHPNTHSITENKFTQFSQSSDPLSDVKPSSQQDKILGWESLPIRSLWDGRLMRTAPLLAGCPILLSNGVSSSSILDRQPPETTAAPSVSPPLNAGPIFGNNLNSSMMPHLPDSNRT
ncbi:unnamed protein product [Rhodiola kirilowii]